ncbi:MAG: hypothetical protein JXA77_02125 [Bacteroidales bacterium]|nr:hypothetical protein [Bacteroidales bacterium]MBN2820052.1 hypothetical protein [Bacteroidales bacterium]
MKNIFLISLLVTIYINAPAQPLKTDEVFINKNGIEKLIVEHIPAAITGENMVTYRLFIDMDNYTAYQLLLGTEETGELFIKTSGTWYNTSDVGKTLGHDILYVLISENHFPALKHDSYFSSGGCADNLIAVPYSENDKGFIHEKPAQTIVFPSALNLDMFKNKNSSDPFLTNDGCISYNPSEKRGVKGPSSSNIVFIGQFTTDGNLMLKLNIQTFDFKTNKAKVTSGILYSSNTN